MAAKKITKKKKPAVKKVKGIRPHTADVNRRRAVLENGLTVMEENFCNEYLVDLSGPMAVQRAGYSFGSISSDRVKASKLLHIPKIKARLTELSKERLLKTKEKMANVIEGLLYAANSNIFNFIKLDKSGDSFNLNKKEIDALPTEIKKTIIGMSNSRYGLKIKLEDKNKARELLAKYLGLITGNDDEGEGNVKKQIIRIGGTEIEF